MSHRNRLTISDYAVVALCPSLIVLLLSSLVYFVILCVYQGGYSSRLGYIWFMFILGAVNIARLSIEQSRAYATGYAAVLAIATFFVLSRFQSLSGSAAALAPMVNFLLLATVWFLADRITYDCTLIDDDADASGQGLLDGLSSSNSDDSGNSPTAAISSAISAPPRRRRRARQPGRTVLWLTGAALPLFGAGQVFLRGDERLQTSALFALAIYLFATLSLLVATSFLGVRRYLRQRGVDMPRTVATAWLGGGIVTTAIILALCFALPQPGRMLASLELPSTFESPDWLSPSKYGWGSETAGAGQAGESPSDAPESQSSSDQGNSQGDAQNSQSGDAAASNSGQAQGDTQGNKASDSKQPGGEKSGGETAGGEQSGGEQSGGEQSGGEQSGGEKAGGEKSGGEKSRGEQSGGEQSGGEQSGGEQSGGEKTGDNQGNNKPADSSQQDDSSSENSDAEQTVSETESSSEPSQASPPESPLSDLLPSISSLFKAIIYIVLLAIIAAFLWLNREAIADFWKRFTHWLAGRRVDPLPAHLSHRAVEPHNPLRPFSSFNNPLARGADGQVAVIETFQATEAWYREQGYPRRSDETAHEYTARLRVAGESERQTLARLADAYNRIVYGGGTANDQDLQNVKNVWQSFRTKVKPQA